MALHPPLRKLWQLCFCFILGLLVLGQLQRWPLSTTVAIYLHDSVMCIWVIAWLILTRKPKRWSLADGRVTLRAFWLELTWLFWVAVGLFIATFTEGAWAPWLYLGRLVLYTLWLVSIKQLKLFSHSVLQYLLLVSGGLLTWLSLLQYVLVPDTRFLYWLGWDDHYFRLIGTQLDPNFTGMLLVLSLLLALHHFHQTKLISLKWALGLLATVETFALAATFSRASFVSLVAALGLAASTRAWQKKPLLSFRTICVTLLFLILSIVIVPKPTGEGVLLTRTSSIESRITNNQTAVASLQPHQQLFGAGIFTSNTLSNTYLMSHAHFADNLLVFLYTGTGIVGTVLALAALVKWGIWLWQHSNIAAVALVATLIHSQFNHTLFQPFVWLWLGLTLISTVKTRVEMKQ